MSSKARGRSTIIHEIPNAPLISNIANSTISSLQQQYVPSLLKIESVVPTRLSTFNNHRNSHRGNRLIYRSYSTLCNNSTINYKNVSKKINTNLQRQKNNFQQDQRNGFTEPASKNAGAKTAQTDSTIVLENGYCKIRRENKEREKQSDRINLDRRGLSSIPIIENEPNLRLLSLQHNLINKFFIPDHEILTAAPLNEAAESGNPSSDNNKNMNKTSADTTVLDGVKDTNNNISTNENEKSVVQPQQASSISSNNNNMNALNCKSLAPKPFLKQKSTSRNQLNLNFNNNATSTSFLQKSLFVQSKSNLLKKSNSLMINNYTPPTTPIQAGSFLFNRNKLIATPSFSIVEENHRDITNTSILENSNLSSSNGSNLISSNNSHNINNSSNILANQPISIKYSLTNLVFLDLYNNQIERIENLDGLQSLTVLLLGKNRISDIAGIVSLKNTLRVLDLHGNKINNINQKISELQELKSLNLAGNLIRHIQPKDFAGLFCLKELNLKRNRIKKINGFDDLHNLERLWLCHNDLHSIEDMQAIAKSVNLKEMTIENNPISLAGDCVSFLVSYLPLLTSLNQLQITEQVRRAANAWRKSKENTDLHYQTLSSDVCHSIRREEIISNARTNWELIRSQQSTIISSSHRHNFKRTDSKSPAPPKTSQNQSKHLSSSSSTTSSNHIQENGIIKKAHVKKNLIEAKKSKPKLVRSSSQENTNSVLSEQDEDIDYFHLPPILAPYLEPEKNPSTSSMKPNVDSGSDTLSNATDNEDERGSRSKSKVPTTPPIVVSQPPSPFDSTRSEISYTPPLPILTNDKETILSISPVLETPIDIVRKSPSPMSSPSYKEKAILTIIDSSNGICLQPATTETLEILSKSSTTIPEILNKSDPEISDKLSTISKNSVKTSSDSLNTLSSANEERERVTVSRNQQHTNNSNNHHPHTASTKHRSANHKSKVLTRAQTARNFTSSANNHSNKGNNSNNTNNDSNSVQSKQKEQKKDVEKDQGADYLVEICGRYLNIYGVGALKFVDKQWNMQKANDVHTVKFSYINFNSISPILGKVKNRFANVENYLFRETNITCLGQLNSLADTQGLKSITIEAEGNPISTKSWRSYAIFRLSHWGLKQINGIEITEDEIQDAEQTYNGLADLVLWSLPDSLLQPLFTRLHVEEVLQNSKVTAKEWLMQYADESIRQVVGKEALQWKKSPNNQDETTIRRKGKVHFSSMMENTCNAVEKLHKLEFLWPTILVEIIRNTLIDYSQIDVYVRNLMSELLKENK